MFLYNKIQGDELKRYYFALLQCPRNKLILQQPLPDVHFYDGFLFCPIQSLLLRLNGVIMEIQPDHFQRNGCLWDINMNNWKHGHTIHKF